MSSTSGPQGANSEQIDKLMQANNKHARNDVGTWIVVFIASAWFALGSTSLAAASRVVVLPERANKDLKQQLEALTKLGAPAALMLVGQGNDVVRGALGTADRKSGRAASLKDHWRIASVTKMVTATVIMQLVREGLLTLDDPVSKHLPRAFPLASTTSIRQLLNHTSGLPDYLVGARVPINVSARQMKANLRQKRSFARLLGDAKRQQRMVQPGEMHAYSNTNYLLLGRIIERVTGLTYQNVVRQRILKPLKLANTEFPSREGRIRKPNLHGYVLGDSKKRAFSDRKRLVDVTTHTYFPGADGGLVSNLEDLTNLMSAIWVGPLLTDAERVLMTSNLVSDHDGIYGYGFGVTAFKLTCGITVFGHEGHDLGSYTLALTDRLRGRNFVLAINTAIVDRPDIEKQVHSIRDRAFCGPSN